MKKNSKKETKTIEELLEETLVPEVEQPYNIPNNWVWSKLGENAFVTKLAGFEFTKYVEYKECGDIPVIRAQNISKSGFVEKNFIYVDRNIMEKLPRSRVYGGELLMVFVGSVGNVAILPSNREYFLGPNVAKIALNYSLLNKYTYYFFLSNLGFEHILEKQKATTQASISMGNIRSILIPLPPLQEQKRIVEKLESILGKIKQAKDLIEEAKDTFKNRRASILAKAFSGELTKNWREENPITKQPQLLPKEENIIKDITYNIPEPWKWLRIMDIGTVKGGKRLPKGEKLVSYNTGYPYIKAGNLKNGTVIEDNIEFLPINIYEGIKNYTINDGDVYITIVGACIGDVGIIPKSFHKANLTENAAKITNLKINNFFLYFWLSSSFAQNEIGSKILSATLGKLSLDRIKSLNIPIPYIEEQKEIVRIVENLLKIEDEALEKIESMEEHLELLEKSILSKAFRGELGTNNPDEESSLNLLKEILEESKNDIVSIKDINKISNKKEQISFLN